MPATGYLIKSIPMPPETLREAYRAHKTVTGIRFFQTLQDCRIPAKSYRSHTTVGYGTLRNTTLELSILSGAHVYSDANSSGSHRSKWRCPLDTVMYSKATETRCISTSFLAMFTPSWFSSSGNRHAHWLVSFQQHPTLTPRSS